MSNVQPLAEVTLFSLWNDVSFCRNHCDLIFVFSFLNYSLAVHTNFQDVKEWPENVDSAAHYKTTTKIIDRIQQIIRSLQRVEEHVQNDSSVRESLQKCLIPMDLLELMDHNASTTKQDKDFGLNPECYASGLLREATGQLAGLKRRKKALEMLGAAIDRGLGERNKTITTTKQAGSLKRDRDEERENSSQKKTKLGLV